ncbi:hypothetical protein HFO25_32455 [Rhizobium laguerreae]|nr:hypothetical protein [Rhizobium laguerreae]
MAPAFARRVATERYLSLPANICRAVTPRTRLIYFDTPTNPLGDILDIAAIAECGRSCGLKIVR